MVTAGKFELSTSIFFLRWPWDGVCPDISPLAARQLAFAARILRIILSSSSVPAFGGTKKGTR
jgi:hypothetical protein